MRDEVGEEREGGQDGKKVHFVETKKGTRERSEKEEETVGNRR